MDTKSKVAVESADPSRLMTLEVDFKWTYPVI